jgi:hypothetical protein
LFGPSSWQSSAPAQPPPLIYHNPAVRLRNPRQSDHALLRVSAARQLLESTRAQRSHVIDALPKTRTATCPRLPSIRSRSSQSVGSRPSGASHTDRSMARTARFRASSARQRMTIRRTSTAPTTRAAPVARRHDHSLTCVPGRSPLIRLVAGACQQRVPAAVEWRGVSSSRHPSGRHACPPRSAISRSAPCATKP